jgi:hypothetical protein
MEALHCDLQDYGVIAYDGARYSYLLKDDATRMTFAIPIANKSDVYLETKRIVAFIKRQFDVNVKVIQSDGGGEFVNNEMDAWLAAQGIVHRKTSPHSSQQNGVAERANRIACECTRAILKGRGLNDKLWSEAIRAHAHIRNRVPSRALGGQVPWTILTGCKPDISHLRIIGSKAYAVMLPTLGRKKLADISEKLILVGYATHTKGWRLFDPITHRVKIRRDVTFDESSTSVIVANEPDGEPFFDSGRTEVDVRDEQEEATPVTPVTPVQPVSNDDESQGRPRRVTHSPAHLQDYAYDVSAYVAMREDTDTIIDSARGQLARTRGRWQNAWPRRRPTSGVLQPTRNIKHSSTTTSSWSAIARTIRTS